MTKRLIGAALIACGMASAVLFAQGGIGPIMMLSGKVDSGNALVVKSVSAGTVGSAASTIGNLPGKVDSNNALVVTFGSGDVVAPATGAFTWTGRSKITSPADGNILLTNNAATDFGLLQFGGTTSAFPALKRNGTSLDLKLADDSGLGGLNVGSLALKAANSGLYLGTGPTLLASATAPTVTSAGTSPSITGNGTVTFRVNVGTGGTATTIVLGMPAAGTGWNCNGSNITAAAANRNPTGLLLQQSSTASAVTMQYQTVATGVALAFVASDIVQMSCFAY